MKISIIMPTKNSAKTITKSINSIIDQNYTNWELIIIDGKSNDQTVSLVNNFQINHKNIIFYSSNDKNYAEAINKGFKKANGEYIFILSSDNWLHKSAFKSLISKTKNNKKVIYGDFLFIKKDNINLGYYYSTNINDIPYRMSICPEALIFPKKLLKNVNGYDDKISIAADDDFFLRIYKYLGDENFIKCEKLITYFVDGGLAEKIFSYFQTMKNSLRAKYNPMNIIFFYFINSFKLVLKYTFLLQI